jgi:hypothetical protein
LQARALKRPSVRARRRLRVFVWVRDRGTCQLCGRRVMFSRMTLDRKETGGRYNQANTQAAHLACNQERADQPLERWKATR